MSEIEKRGRVSGQYVAGIPENQAHYESPAESATDAAEMIPVSEMTKLMAEDEPDRDIVVEQLEHAAGVA